MIGYAEVAELSSARALLDQLFAESRLYTQSKDYKELLDFAVRLPNFAPFNAMLLQIQKPGLSFAASAHDWETLFGRRPKEDARPLLILWPFGPVALVYDELDTAGKELPRDVRSFFARGPIDSKQIRRFRFLMEGRSIHSKMIDAGDRRAGSIRLLERPVKPKESFHYGMAINVNHEPAVQFVTIAHELAHLLLGHLGQDSKLKVPGRTGLTREKQEFEAESVAYLVCKRNGVESASETYLADFVKYVTTSFEVDVYQIMRAAGQVEMILQLGRRSGFGQCRNESKRRCRC
jgi:hypothetical protein